MTGSPPANPIAPPDTAASGVRWGDAIRVWIIIGLLSFGGPAGQIALMHRILVEQRRWITERQFLHALNYCMLLPGPEAMQLATYVGWLLHGLRGGLAAGVLFVLPGFISILALSVVYVLWGESRFILAGLAGLSAAVVAIVIEALIRIGRRTLRSRTTRVLAGAAFAAIFFFGVPFPIIIASAAVVGLVVGRMVPGEFPSLLRKMENEGGAPARGQGGGKALARRTIGVIVVWLVVWWGPIAALALIFGPTSMYVQQGVFFSKTAVVTFGGAYAVLAYVAQQAVEVYAWLSPEEMILGLALAETTPGPLIMVLQFVGFLGAYHAPAPLSPMGGAILASVVATWATFAPCFLWIFAGAPFIERLEGHRHLAHALTAVTASIVGVILNLALWFAIHAIFANVSRVRAGPASFVWPEVGSVHVWLAAIALAACVMMFVLHWRMMVVLGVCLTAAIGVEVMVGGIVR